MGILELHLHEPEFNVGPHSLGSSSGESLREGTDHGTAEDEEGGGGSMGAVVALVLLVVAAVAIRRLRRGGDGGAGEGGREELAELRK